MAQNDTSEQLIRRFAWLCAELMAGNEFGREQLMTWYSASHLELARRAVQIRRDNYKEDGP